MEIFSKPSTSKLVTGFDNQLKNMLLEDLKAFMAKIKFITSNIQASATQSLPIL